jgi:hypothetical protein
MSYGYSSIGLKGRNNTASEDRLAVAGIEAVGPTLAVSLLQEYFHGPCGRLYQVLSFLSVLLIIWRAKYRYGGVKGRLYTASEDRLAGAGIEAVGPTAAISLMQQYFPGPCGSLYQVASFLSVLLVWRAIYRYGGEKGRNGTASEDRLAGAGIEAVGPTLAVSRMQHYFPGPCGRLYLVPPFLSVLLSWRAKYRYGGVKGRIYTASEDRLTDAGIEAVGPTAAVSRMQQYFPGPCGSLYI